MDKLIEVRGIALIHRALSIIEKNLENPLIQADTAEVVRFSNAIRIVEKLLPEWSSRECIAKDIKDLKVLSSDDLTNLPPREEK